MSLIGDALRKTRQEAADRDSDRKGVLFSAKIADGPNRSGLGLGLVLGALIAVFATVAGGAAAWWVLNQRTPEPQASETTDSNTEPDFDRRVGLAPPSASPPISAGGTHTESEAMSEPPEGTDTPDRGRDARATTEAAPLDPVPNVVNRPQAPAPETGFIGKEDGINVYLMEAKLGDVTLSLDFLVFRATDPYAEINGSEVHVGGIVAGFRVKSVERDRVVLSDGRRTIVLRAP